MNHKAYVVLVNYKGHFDTVECLESLLKSSYEDFQILLVDNSPNDEPLEYIEAWAKRGIDEITTKYEHLVLPLNTKPLDHIYVGEDEFLKGDFLQKLVIIKAKKNLGFSAANNIAIKYALKQNDFAFLWLLNNDTVVKKGSLTELINHSKSHPEIGILGSKLILYNDSSTLQGVGGNYNRWFGRVVEIGAGQNVNWKPSSTEKIDYIIGASMFMKKEMIVDTGILSEDYFLYFEELDMAIRAKQKGWDLGYCEKSEVFHKGGASINTNNKGNSEIADFYSARNRIIITKKYFPYAFPSLTFGFLLFIYNRLKLGQFSRIKMLLNIFLKPEAHYQALTSNDSPD